MKNTLNELLNANAPYLPFCDHYAALLSMVQEREHCDREQARHICGTWTYAQFNEYLNN